MTTATPAWSPVAVTMVELGAPAAPPGPPYERAWVVGCRSGVPVGIAEVDLRDRHGWQRGLAELSARTHAGARLPDDDALLPSLSVVIPTIVQRTEDLQRCLTSVHASEYPDVEVVLVDNRTRVPEEDPLPGVLARFPQVRLVEERRPGISAARNAGLVAARNDVVVFTDDDVRVQPGWLRAVGRRFAREPELTVVTGLVLPAELATPAQLHYERFYGGFGGLRTFEPLTLRPGSTRGHIEVVDADGQVQRRFALYGVGSYGAGANMAFRRAWLDDGHAFDLALGAGTRARGGEDLAALVDVVWSGGRIGYEPSAVVLHRHRSGADELRRQLVGNGLGFTASLAALVAEDPRHLWHLARQVPLAGLRLAGEARRRLADRPRSPRVDDRSASRGEPGDAYPRSLVLHELGGMPRGPWAYARSRRAARRWRRPDAPSRPSTARSSSST